MKNIFVHLMSLRFLCALEADEIKKLSPAHPLLRYQNKDLSDDEQKVIRHELYATFGPKEMHPEDPSIHDLISCYKAYYVELVTVLTIEKARSLARTKQK